MAATLLIAAAALSGLLTSADELALSRPELRLGDVAQVRGPQSEQASALVIARLTAGTTKRVERKRIAELVRRALPSISVSGPVTGSIRISAPALSPAPPPNCYEAAANITAGEAITNGKVRAVQCSARTAAAVGSDLNRGIATAAAAIEPGDYLGQLLVGDAPAIDRGEKLTLVSRAGPVTIAREVVALQPAARGQRRLFVGTSDGSVISAPLASGLPK